MYKTYTMEEKLNFFRAFRGQIALIRADDRYEELKYNPNCSPKPEHLYLTSLFQVDYTEELKTYSDFCDGFNIQELLDTRSWHLGDAFNDIMFDYYANYEYPVTKETIEAMDKELIKLHLGFQRLTQKHEYVDSGIIHDGEKLYRRLLK